MSDIARFPLYDLHSHTQASDGLLTPTALVLRAVEMHVGVLAITDHDSVAGVAEAQAAVQQLQTSILIIAYFNEKSNLFRCERCSFRPGISKWSRALPGYSIFQ